MGTSGEKRKRISIRARTPTSDGQGGRSVTYTTTLARLWAHERPLNGAEALRAAQVTAVLSSVWEIWYRGDISVKDRIYVGSRVLEIESFLDPKDDRKELHLYCSEVQT